MNATKVCHETEPHRDRSGKGWRRRSFGINKREIGRWLRQLKNSCTAGARSRIASDCIVPTEDGLLMNGADMNVLDLTRAAL